MSETVRDGGLGASTPSDPVLATARSIEEVELPELDGGEAIPASPLEPAARAPPAGDEPSWQDATPHRMARFSPVRLRASMRKTLSLDEAQFEGLISPKAPKPKKIT